MRCEYRGVNAHGSHVHGRGDVVPAELAEEAFGKGWAQLEVFPEGELGVERLLAGVGLNASGERVWWGES